MPEPIVFIAHHKIKPGSLEGYKQTFREVKAFIQPNKLNTVVFMDFVNSDGTEATLIQVYPSAEAMEEHVQGLGEVAKRSYEFMDLINFEIYGQPNPATLEAMAKLSQSGVPVMITPHFVDGFLRMKSG